VNRTELQQLSAERIKDAQLLLAAGQWSGAYYLAGYALECALKSCILARIERTGVVFEDKKFAEKCWTHDIQELVKQADLMAERDHAMSANPVLGQTWQVAKDWSELGRYRLFTQLQAERLFLALTDNANGVLPWVKNHW
jgi:HEPN domain-containing protein